MNRAPQGRGRRDPGVPEALVAAPGVSGHWQQRAQGDAMDLDEQPLDTHRPGRAADRDPGRSGRGGVRGRAHGRRDQDRRGVRSLGVGVEEEGEVSRLIGRLLRIPSPAERSGPIPAENHALDAEA